MNKLKPKMEENYGIWSGKIGTYFIPMCPKCNEPLYEIEKCVFCGQEIDTSDFEEESEE